MTLNHQDIEAILKVIDDSPYDELRLDGTGFSLYLKRTADGWIHSTAPEASSEPHPLPQSAPEPARKLQPAAPLNAGVTASASREAPAAVARTEPAPGESGLVDIRATMVGTFYRSPQPGAAAFVEIGSVVTPNTVIGIIEVMKLMSSTPALVSGVIREILAEDVQLVEKGQLLMRVKP